MIKGVDLSKWNEGLKIADVKKAGYQFAILRGGYTGYGYDRQKVKDPLFEDYYKQAKANNMPVGCYWYSCANTYQGGIDEATYLYANCLKGKQFEYPIYIDVEESRWQANDKKGVTDAIIGFCDTLERLGYYVGVYASLDWFKNKIDTNRLNKYVKWVAAWTAIKPNFNWNAFYMWQNSDNGYIGKYRVDTNIVYVDFPTIIKNKGCNGFTKPVAAKPTTPSVTYFKRYTGKSVSIVDALNAIGANSKFSYRQKIAKANGIKAYTGLPYQNTKMLNLLKQGKLIRP